MRWRRRVSSVEGKRYGDTYDRLEACLLFAETKWLKDNRDFFVAKVVMHAAQPAP